MFIIREDEIQKEFDKTSWTSDYKKALTVADKVYQDEPCSREELKKLAEFETRMQCSNEFMTEYPDEVKGYIFIKDALFENGFAPDAFEYGIFGNIVTDPSDEFDKDIDYDKLGSIGYLPQIDKIVSNDPDTIVFFADGTQSHVRCEKKEEFNAETGIYLAILKKAIGNQNLQHLFTLINTAKKAALDKTKKDAKKILDKARNAASNKPEQKYECKYCDKEYCNKVSCNKAATVDDNDDIEYEYIPIEDWGYDDNAALNANDADFKKS